MEEKEKVKKRLFANRKRDPIWEHVYWDPAVAVAVAVALSGSVRILTEVDPLKEEGEQKEEEGVVRCKYCKNQIKIPKLFKKVEKVFAIIFVTM